MSASFQAFPQLGPPPPGMFYPTPMTTTTTSANDQVTTSQSSGSFGMVFVVLAIILVVSAVACVLGRFCTKKPNKSSGHKTKAHKHHTTHGETHHKPNHHNPKIINPHGPSKHGKAGRPNPKDPDLEFGYRSKEGDIMMGFEPKVKLPSSKVANNNGDFRGDRFGKQQGMKHAGEFRDFP